MKYVLSLLLFLACTGMAQAQTGDKKATDTIASKKGNGNAFVVDGAGLQVVRYDSGKHAEKRFEMSFGMLDLGFNRIDDKTNYNNSTPEMTQLLGYDPSKAGHKPEVLPLREGKSINVNIWPLMAKYRLLNGKTERMYLISGIGLQIYNFRWEGTQNYSDQPYTHLQSHDDLHISKNKLGITYLTIPLELQFTTKMAPKATLVYGFGITGGYRLDSWTKIKSAEYGKQKNHDDFDLQDFNSCLMGEIGIKGIFRLYGSYQLTPLHKDVLDQHPFSIGVRFLGI